MQNRTPPRFCSLILILGLLVFLGSGGAFADDLDTARATLRDPNATEVQKQLAESYLRNHEKLQKLEQKLLDLEKKQEHKLAELSKKLDQLGAPPVFGKPITGLAANTAHTAASDGFVVAYWGGSGSVQGADVRVGDGELRGRNHVDAYGGIVSPIRKGESYTVQTAPRPFLAQDLVIYFIPIGR